MPQIVNNQFRQERSLQYRLSIQTDLNGFSFSIVAPLENRLRYLSHHPLPTDVKEAEHIAEHFQDLFKEEPLLELPYMGVEMLCNHHKYTAIPSVLYSADRAVEDLEKIHYIDDLDEVHTVEFPHWQMVLIYSLNGTLMNIMKQHYPNFRSYHSIETYLKFLPYFKEHNKLFLQFFEGFSTIIAMENTSLLFLNSFPTLHFNSALYHLLAVLKEVQFNPRHTTLYISGNLKEMELFDLSNYFSNIKYFRNPELPLPDSSAELKFSTLLFNRNI